MLLHCFQKGVAPADLGGGVERTLYVDNSDLRVFQSGLRFKISLQPGAGPVSLQAEVGTGPDCVEILIFHLHFPVNDDHGNAGVLCLLKRRIPAVLRHRIQNDIIDILSDEFPDRFNLVLLFLLAVAEDEVIAVVGSKYLLHGSAARKPPVGFGPDLGKTDRQLLSPVDRNRLFIEMEVRAGFFLPPALLSYQAA